MSRKRSLVGLAGLAACLLSIGHASTIQRLSFDALIDQSDLIVSGTITRSWTAWGSSHRYIWTHYEMAVSGAAKGTPGATVTISEPGGVLDGQGFAVGGAVVYQPGETVLVFLNRVPNGYLRTTGWAQGKCAIDQFGRLHGGVSLRDVAPATAKSGASSLEGLTLQQAFTRIAAHTRGNPGRTQ